MLPSRANGQRCIQAADVVQLVQVEGIAIRVADGSHEAAPVEGQRLFEIGNEHVDGSAFRDEPLNDCHRIGTIAHRGSRNLAIVPKWAFPYGSASLDLRRSERSIECNTFMSSLFAILAAFPAIGPGATAARGTR